MNFFDHKDLGNHLLQLCPKVMKHPVLQLWKVCVWAKILKSVLGALHEKHAVQRGICVSVLQLLPRELTETLH